MLMLLLLMSTQDTTQKSLTMLKSEFNYWRTAMTTMISDSSSVEGADHGGAGSDGAADSHACGKAIPHGDAAAGDAACDGSADGLGCDQTGNATNFHNAVAKAISASVQVVGQGCAWQFGDPVPSTPASEWALSRGWGPPTPLLQHILRLLVMLFARTWPALAHMSSSASAIQILKVEQHQLHERFQQRQH